MADRKEPTPPTQDQLKPDPPPAPPPKKDPYEPPVSEPIVTVHPPQVVKRGVWVEFSHMRYGKRGHDMEWMPMLVTHVSEGWLSGVAFSGEPAAIGWHRGAMEFDHVSKGTEARCWRWPE